jgi:hypothetical protein
MAMSRALTRVRIRSLVAVATVVSLLSLSVAASVHNGNDDPDSGPQLTLHNHAAHRLAASASSSPTAPEHCFLCHWTSLRTLQATVQVYIPEVKSGTFVASASLGTARATLLSPSLRAPPLV